jgi:cytochrome c peroxidase
MRAEILVMVVLAPSAMTMMGCDSGTGSRPMDEQLRSSPKQLSLEELGATIFFDERLSATGEQACSACHAPEVGYTGPDLLANLAAGVYEGSIHNRFGGRRAPSSAYGVFAPIFSFEDGEFVGGSFWDGRATGWSLGDPAADQARGPFLNPLEQALASGAIVVELVCDSSYDSAFKSLWGNDACKNSDFGFAAVARSLAAFERSASSSRFQSKYDAYLAGEVTLTPLEAQGLALFDGPAKCSGCHVLDTAEDLPGPLFTDFTYENIGVPRNLANPFYRMNGVEVNGQPINPLGFAWVDPGLGGFLEQLSTDDAWRDQPYVPESMANLSAQNLGILAQSSRGKHKVPSLRNVALRPFPAFEKRYTHNGYFATLRGLVHFYNTRDVLPQCAGDFPEAVALQFDCWPAPEVPETVNHDELGDLGLSPAEEAAIVAFLETLSDGFSE